jgi:hypothetical protein
MNCKERKEHREEGTGKLKTRKCFRIASRLPVFAVDFPVFNFPVVSSSDIYLPEKALDCRVGRFRVLAADWKITDPDENSTIANYRSRKRSD